MICMCIPSNLFISHTHTGCIYITLQCRGSASHETNSQKNCHCFSSNCLLHLVQGNSQLQRTLFISHRLYITLLQWMNMYPREPERSFANAFGQCCWTPLHASIWCCLEWISYLHRSTPPSLQFPLSMYHVTQIILQVKRAYCFLVSLLRNMEGTPQTEETPDLQRLASDWWAPWFFTCYSDRKAWLIELSDEPWRCQPQPLHSLEGRFATLPGCSYFKIIQPVKSSLTTVYGVVPHAHTWIPCHFFLLPNDLATLVLVCKLQSGHESSRLANTHTAEVAVAQLIRKGL